MLHGALPQGEALLALQESPAAAARLVPLQASPETAAAAGEQQQQQQKQHQAGGCELWGVVRWPSAAAAAAGNTGSCTLQVGGDCMQGKVTPFKSAGGPGALAVLRHVRRRLVLDIAGCAYTPAPAAAAAAATAEVTAAWELQGTVENTIAFCDAPTLDPFKEAFALQAAGLGPQQQQQQQHGAAASAAAAATGAAADTAESNAVWLVAPSPQLPHLHGAWQLLQLDAVLREELQRQQQQQRLLLLKGRPAALPPPRTSAQMRAEAETLLCSRSSSFLVSRNAIDGEILVCCRSTPAAAAATAAAGDDDCMAVDQNGTSSSNNNNSSNRNGVTVVGICKSVLQLERARGRIYQVQQLLQLPLQQLLLVHPGAVPAAAAAAGRTVLPSAWLLQQIQAAPTETAAVLLGDPRLASVDPFTAGPAAAAPAATPTASQQQQEQPQQTLQQRVALLLKQLPPLWGTVPQPSPSAALFDPEMGGFFSVPSAVLRTWVLRTADCLALANSSSSSSSSSEWFSVGWALDAVRECKERHGVQMPGLRVHPKDAAAAAAAGDAAAETGEDTPLLTAGLLLQLLREFCDIRLTHAASSSRPTALGNCCPPLPAAAAAAAAPLAADVGSDLVDLLGILEATLRDGETAKKATAAVNPLKLHVLLAAETAERMGVPLQLQYGVAFTATAPVVAADTKDFCIALGKAWQRLPLRIFQWGERYLTSRVAALRSAAAVATAGCELQQQEHKEATDELLLAAADEIPLLAVWVHWQQLQQGGNQTISATALLRCCTYGFPELRTDFAQQQEQQTEAAAAKCLLYPNRPPQDDAAGREAAAAAARLMHAAVAAAAAATTSSSSNSREFAALLPEAAERPAFLRGMLLSPLRGSFVAVEGQLLLLPSLLLPLTLRERLAAAFAAKSLWREEELQPLLRDCRCSYAQERVRRVFLHTAFAVAVSAAAAAADWLALLLLRGVCCSMCPPSRYAAALGYPICCFAAAAGLGSRIGWSPGGLLLRATNGDISCEEGARYFLQGTEYPPALLGSRLTLQQQCPLCLVHLAPTCRDSLQCSSGCMHHFLCCICCRAVCKKALQLVAKQCGVPPL